MEVHCDSVGGRWRINDLPQLQLNPLENAQTQQFIPEALDLHAWLDVSKQLQRERHRVLKDLSNVCREFVPVSMFFLSTDYFPLGLTFLSVHLTTNVLALDPLYWNNFALK